MLKIAVFVTLVAYVYADQSEKKAQVYLFDPNGVSHVVGSVIFTKTADHILIHGTVSGLTPGKHGFHIHELGHISAGCMGTGGHFNPHKVNHGAPEDKTRHIGDLGNIIADSTGTATIKIKDTTIELEGDNSIIGRAVVVHAGEDDLGKGGHSDSLTTGHAGGRLACGVIGHM